MQPKQSFVYIPVLLGLIPVFVADASPLQTKPELNGQARAIRATFDTSNASLDEFASYALSVSQSRVANSSTCTADKIRVRKEWAKLSGDERIAYTGALRCLQSLPAKTPSDLAPGAKTRYDDWVVTHINQSLTVHDTASFLGWHRWFIWEMEENLRTDCNYTGALPYWDWTITEQTGFANSPMFDGSATSLSGNGAPVNYSNSDVVVLFNGTDYEVTLPHGTGGGCVTSGPFANYTVNLGPDSLTLMNGYTDSSGYEFLYNPRCLKRSLTDYALQRFVNTTSVLDLLRGPQDIWTFETLAQGPEDVAELGVHGGAHYSLGGDPGRDFYVSPGDPVFWSHHANLDRVWWMWQMQDPDARAANVSTAVNGPLSLYNEYDPHGNGTIFTEQNVGYVAEGTTVPLGELTSTTDGIFCYVYE